MLEERIRGLGKAAVAFSGGVDSSLLAKLCFDILGKENAVAITIDSPLFPRREIKEAERIAKEIGIRHIIIKEDLEESVAVNPKNRCYLCKKSEIQAVKKIAGQNGFRAVLDGATAADTNEYRPGIRACREEGSVSPLLESGMGKEDVRKKARELGLSNWNKPSNACLASRIPAGERISLEKIERIEKAENYLQDLGFEQVRVRNHGEIARIEVGDTEKLLRQDIKKISETLKSMGFKFVTVDLDGYRPGSVNQ